MSGLLLEALASLRQLSTPRQVSDVTDRFPLIIISKL
jgi:hypothetical protein